MVNGPGGVAVHGQDVGGEGVTYNALPREGRLHISSDI